MGAVKVQILGSEYVLNSPAGEVHLRRVAAHLNAALNEVLSTNNTSSTMAATVLAALNITHELLQLRERQDSQVQEIEALAGRLLERIEQELKIEDPCAASA